MRITPRKMLLSALLILGVLFLVHLVVYLSKGNDDGCLQRPGDDRKLAQLAERVHRALQLLQVQHFLCYEGLWAALYNEGPRNWDRSVDFCLVGPTFSSQDEGFVSKLFRNQNLDLNYDLVEGVYWVKLAQESGAQEPNIVNARLILFQESQQESKKFLRKSGVKRALLPENCDNQLLDCFPEHLASPPLPNVKFGRAFLPAPREGIEIQKYHYPNDWWLQRKIPPSC